MFCGVLTGSALIAYVAKPDLQSERGKQLLFTFQKELWYMSWSSWQMYSGKSSKNSACLD